ncbi:hypothetical protein AURDEDRAFT_155802 [Auricularia subglabra TFB-10046 SS5]|nr:hypothetical protein AURDEDRAFT_155802 [Auricularia subglabra TFB-10046 SS5]
MSTLLDPQLNPQPPVNDAPDVNTEREEPKHDPEQPAERPDAGGVNEPPPDVPVCRICLMNADEAPEMGKLIRPCLCRGTVGHVHVQCLNQWRKASSSRKAFWQCDQCGYKYQLVRTRALGIAQSRLVVGASTLTLFTLIVFTVSFLSSLFLPSEWIDGTPSTVARLVDQSVEDQYNSWYGGSWWYYSSSGFTNSMWKVAYQALNEIFDDTLFPQQEQATRESTSYRYKAPPRRVKQKAQPKMKVAKQAVPVDARRDDGAGPFKSTVAVPRTAAEKPTRLQREHGELYDDDDFGPPARPSFLVRMVRRFLLGLSVVGAFSFMTFGWSVTFPLQWVRRRAAGNRRGEARDSYGIIVLLMILIGAGKAMYSTYKLTQTLSTELLRRAETAILEVGSNEAVPLEEPVHPFQFTRDRLRKIGTRAFWRDLWWTCIRWLRGAKDSVVEVWNVVRQELNWRDIFAALSALVFALFGGGVWVWQF